MSQAVAIPHYGVIANVIQMAEYHKVNEDYTSWENRRFRPGDVAVAGAYEPSLYHSQVLMVCPEHSFTLLS